MPLDILELWIGRIGGMATFVTLAVACVVRSFDPCLACSVHMVRPNGQTPGEFRIT